MVPKLLVLALEFHRTPLRFGHLTDPAIPLPDAYEQWLTETGIALAPGQISETAFFLGTSPEKVRTAFLFFLRQTLLLPQADHYRVLGLSRHCSAQAVKQHHGLLVGLFHPDRTPQDDDRGVALTARINAAYRILRDTQTRRRYDNQLPPLPSDGPATADEQDFFRPCDRIMPLSRGVRPVPEQPARARARSTWLWTLAFLVLFVLLFGAVREPGQPSLRINPELATGSAPGPAFLRGDRAAGTHGEEIPEIASSFVDKRTANLEQPAIVKAVPERAARIATRIRETGESEAARNPGNAKASTAASLAPILAPRNPPLSQRSRQPREPLHR